MLTFRDLSFRYKIPLRATLLVLATAVMLTGANVMREYEQIRADIFDTADSIGNVLAQTLIAPMLHDDLWRAFEIINMPLHSSSPDSLGAELMLVLDAEQRVYVSTNPRLHPVQTPFGDLGPIYAALADELRELSPGTSSRAIELREAGHFHLLMPIEFDGVPLGVLVMEYPKSIFKPRFQSIVIRAALITLLVLSVLLPVSWYWGRRMADPLVRLADCMSMVGERIPEASECRLYESRDEIGLAGARLESMLAALREKQALEQQIIASERLAAIGRLTAGIAHEINNPLGGMLNAISTYKRHGQPEHVATRTLPLLERGLLQIKETVGALLVEARLQSHALTAEDLHDIQTLLHPHIHKKRLHLVWRGTLERPVELPSTHVRQVLLNLLLNAVQAADVGTDLSCEVGLKGDCLEIRVANTGVPISPEGRAHLFEPFVGTSSGGHGLGLWVTYQLVRQMCGSIEVTSGDGAMTVFTVQLPVHAEHHAASSGLTATAIPGTSVNISEPGNTGAHHPTEQQS
jgi:two-component system, NtrC family, sensor kinase